MKKEYGDTMDKLALIPLQYCYNGSFWNKYVELVKDSIIPYQWDILNDKHEGVRMSHCINFKIAAGRIAVNSMSHIC